LRQRLDDQRHPIRPISAVAREHPNSIAFAAADEPEAVVFDFVLMLLKKDTNGIQAMPAFGKTSESQKKL
jgi:hypothetical protein